MEGTLATVPVAEVLGALSLATDLAMGQPMEHGLRTCLLAVELAGRLGVDRDTAHDVYELALLRWVGCTAHAHELSGWFDDEIAAHQRSAAFDFGSPADVVRDLLRHAGARRSLGDRARTVAGALAQGRGAVQDLFASSCEVAGCLAGRFGVRAQVRDGLAHVFARWDGRGWPPEARGESVSLCARIVHVALDAAVFHRAGGRQAATDVVRRRSGAAHDPEVAGAFLSHADDLLAATERLSLWDAVLDAEPGTRHHLAGDEIEGALEAIADFADLKSPWTGGHSRSVARLAGDAAPAYGLDAASARALRHAALVHDLGRVGVPNGVWEKPGPLTTGEWEQVRLHPYLTERILARPKSLRHLGEAASLHHERLDGSGYHHGAHRPTLSPEARLLAAADAFQALTSDRPHRA
ncbi:MAG: HD-GYP domain-containing protein, partial [Acidimicrobiales bacterium]